MNYHISTWRWINFGKLCLLHKRTTIQKVDQLDTGAAQGQDQWPQRPRSLQWLRSLGFQEPRLHSRDLGTWANTLSAVWHAVRHVRDRFLGWLGEKELMVMVFGDLWWLMMYLWIDMLILVMILGGIAFLGELYPGFIQGLIPFDWGICIPIIWRSLSVASKQCEKPLVGWWFVRGFCSDKTWLIGDG